MLITISSLFAFRITDSVYKLKRCGKRMQPCLTPLSIVNALLCPSFHLMSDNWYLTDVVKCLTVIDEHYDVIRCRLLYPGSVINNWTDIYYIMRHKEEFDDVGYFDKCRPN